MATTMKLIAKSVLGSDAADVTFSDIPSTGYTDLYIVASARASYSAVATDILVTFNANTSGYSVRFLYGNGASALSATAPANAFGTLTGSTATANTFASNEIYIPNYAGSTNKSYSVTGVSETNGTTAYALAFAGLWSNSAAITSIKFAPNGGGNIVTGSSFFLYGITKA